MVSITPEAGVGTPGARALAVATHDGEKKTRQPLRYARARDGGASVRNVADAQGLSIGEVQTGVLLAVYSERAGWVEVDAPGGFAVWVFGRFLERTSDEGVLAVTQNNVNMRPSPSTEVSYFPLAQQLQAGDRLTLIELKDPNEDLAKTWVRVWTPPGATGWVQAARTEPLPSGTDGAALWSQAEEVLLEKSRAGGARAIEATAPRPGAAKSALDLAQSLLATERKKPTPDFDAVRAAFRSVLELEPAETLRSQAEQALDLVATLESDAASRANLVQEQQRRQQELAKRQEETWKEQAARDPFDSRFAVRGVLERSAAADGSPLFRVLRGDATVARVTVNSGRYDLNLFAGYEIGLEGMTGFAVDAGAQVLTIDASRLVILGRPR